MDEGFDKGAAERALRRALDLDAEDQASGEAHLLSAADVVEIGAELGVDERYVRRALAEEHLRVRLPPGDKTLDRLAGAGLVAVSRPVPVAAPAALGVIDQWLRGAHALRPTRHRVDAREWVRRRDVVGRAKRTVRAARGGAGLGRVRRLAAVAEPIDDKSCVVLLVADLRDRRGRSVAGGAVVAGTGAAVGVVLGLLVNPLFFLSAGAGAAGGAAAASHHRAIVRDVQLELEALLDALERDARPATIGDAMTKAIKARILAVRPLALTRGQSSGSPPVKREGAPGMSG